MSNGVTLDDCVYS